MEASSNSSLLNETQRDLLISLAKEQEELSKKDGKELGEMSLQEMDAYWDKAKALFKP